MPFDDCLSQVSTPSINDVDDSMVMSWNGNYISVTMLKSSLQAEIKVFSLFGELLFRKDIIESTEAFEFSDLKSGIYIIQVSNENQSKQIKVVKA